MFYDEAIENAGLKNIWEKICCGDRLDFDDGVRLFLAENFRAVGMMADFVRKKMHGKKTYYVINQHINYSNICGNGCKFCAFGRSPQSDLAFQLSLEDISNKVKERLSEPITEIHIVGGCNPTLPFSFYLDVLREVKRLRPKVILKAFTAVEVAHFVRISGLSEKEVLSELSKAGLDVLPGGGAEVFSKRVRKIVCPEKLSGEDWLRISRLAHKMGIKSNATMLFGHVETFEERVDHLIRLRELQDETGGFICFIPLAFQPSNTSLSHLPKVTAIDSLKTIAVSRLLLDNVPHIKAYWIMLGINTAQVALHFGADDLDGTIVEEKIGHMAGAESNQALTRAELIRVIEEAGFEAVERNTYFEVVKKAA
ncbi:MAG: aminofutalosine synthase MqnE [Deltaproteobacteria bacterium]|nr:MAG: aminofutalosine synthase MqnE [Deltaproteobacteria bacterium]